jgi:hypothetical protein
MSLAARQMKISVEAITRRYANRRKVGLIAANDEDDFITRDRLEAVIRLVWLRSTTVIAPFVDPLAVHTLCQGAGQRKPASAVKSSSEEKRDAVQL